MNERKGIDAIGNYRRFLQGDNAALETLVREYSDALVRFAYCYVKDSATAEDIMEDAFATMIVKRRQFSGAENFRAYLYKIVRNKCLDHLRFRKKYLPISDLENVLCGAETEKDVVRRARNHTIYRCMQQLPSQYEEVLYLAYFEDCGVDEICKIVKRSKKQVYNLLTRARLTLKELLKKEGISYEDV